MSEDEELVNDDDSDWPVDQRVYDAEATTLPSVNVKCKFLSRRKYASVWCSKREQWVSERLCLICEFKKYPWDKT